MISLLLALGVLVATFVGFNIGGSSTGVAWGPAVGAEVVNKTAAAGLMTVFVFVGGWTLGRNVIDTLGGDLVPGFSLTAATVILSFIGLGMLVANIYGVPVSTSMTAVGAISGYGFATNTLDRAALGGIVVWWLIAPIVGFWLGSLIGRYIYPYLEQRVSIPESEGPLLTYRWVAIVPMPQLGPGTTSRELYSAILVLLIACYMSFSAGASNVANAVAPLVGGGSLDIGVAVLLGTIAIGIGAFTIARRTMESVGNDITDLPMLAAMVVMVVASTITTFLSWIGIPMSLAMATIMTIVGLGWGRATRTATVPELVTGEAETNISVDTLAAETDDGPAPIGEEDPEDITTATQLFNPGTVVRFVSFWILGPSMATLLSFSFFTVF
ncbi:inorganic phosphate transporter [Halorhabdus sp. CBA1104]|uniref:inorganic phosphate transporter n=1 Tax=unclassified Halorhabdus TaxID=2621901 RepID=UPI0012B3C7F4|nr:MULTISPECIES: inorganic phosphate transporter [unclassified Halorhabdus]QGN06963.1 inorganic phosphate transporter [Halorhabdus sp. CBA1104]